MTVPNPRDWAPGDDATSVLYNLEVRNPLNFLLNPPACSVYRSGAVSNTATGTAILISWDAELYDSTDSMHSTASLPSRIFAPETGLYDVRFGAAWATHGTGYRSIQVGVNTAGVEPGDNAIIRTQVASAGGSVTTQITGSKDVRLIEGDYVEMFVKHGAGVNLNLQVGSAYVHCSLRWVGK